MQKPTLKTLSFSLLPVSTREKREYQHKKGSNFKTQSSFIHGMINTSEEMLQAYLYEES